MTRSNLHSNMNSITDVLAQKADEIFPNTGPANLPDANVPLSQTPTPSIPKEAALYANSPAEIGGLIYHIKDDLDRLLRMVRGETAGSATLPPLNFSSEGGERTLEGIFQGDKMLGSDAKEYAVPPNYASKSKLVSGDKMKLTITRSGSFVYKQIGQMDRRRAIGELIFDTDLKQWSALAEGKTYKLLTAAVTFHKGAPGDEVILLLPRVGDPAWGTVENIVHKSV